MVRFLIQNGASERKLRLLACACCRLVHQQRLIALGAIHVVDGAEASADGEAVLGEISRVAYEIYNKQPFVPGSPDGNALGMMMATAHRSAGIGARGTSSESIRKQYRDQICRRFFCIFGDPFRQASGDATWIAWNNGTVLNIAKAIYDQQSFRDMPILADALEEAGCIDREILQHCRQQEEHVRGCWVVDIILGKE
jgi:hypothetical protein